MIDDEGADAGIVGDPPRSTASSDVATQVERLGMVAFSNVAPLHWQLGSWPGAEFVHGVPTELNRRLLEGSIDLTLISIIEFLRHSRDLRALPDFSVATLGAVTSVTLFHWRPWEELNGATVAVTTDSATSVTLLQVLLQTAGIRAELQAMPPDLEAMLGSCDAALLIGDAALVEALGRRRINARLPLMTDLGEAWYHLTRLPFTFAVWASRRDHPPSAGLVAELRRAREQGLGRLAEVARAEAARLGLPAAALQRYLGNFRYYLELPDRDGLMTFGRLALPDFDPARVCFWQL